MVYPSELKSSLALVEQTRGKRLKTSFPRLTSQEKSNLLEGYHPDHRPTGRVKLKVGPNTGELVPKELGVLIHSYSKINPNAFDLAMVKREVDVLVVGGGGAGVTSALYASEKGAKVLMVTKLRLGDSNTIMAEGGIGAATEPDDSPYLHYLDTIGGGGYKNIPELVEILVNDAPQIVEWLEDLGVMFDRKPDGSILTHAPGGHCRRRSHSCKDLTGLEIMRTLKDELYNQEIDVLEFAAALELILDEDGKCAGAIVRDMDTNEDYIVKAKAVIIATGGMGRLHMHGFPTSNHYGATADGIVMAYHAGAPLAYIDAVQYHPTGVAWPEQMLGQLITEAIRANGANLVNKEGQVFINELETRDACTSAIIRECEQKRGVITPTETQGVWLDIPMIDIIGGQGKVEKQFTGVFKKYLDYDIDIRKEPILVYPTQHYQNGGILVDASCRTKVPGLFVAGEAAGGVHGRNRLGSNSLVDIFVFGRRAGIAAAGYSLEAEVGEFNLEYLQGYHRELEKAGIEPGGTSPLLLPDYINARVKKRRLNFN